MPNIPDPVVPGNPEDNGDEGGQKPEPEAEQPGKAEQDDILAGINGKDEWDKTEDEIKQEIELETENIVQSDLVQGLIDGLTSTIIGDEYKEDVEQVVRSVVKTTKIVQKATIDNPVAEKINDVARDPAVTTVTAASIASVATIGATSATGASVLTYFQFLFTQPLLLFARRRKQGWGVVYNSITKNPVDLAVVRVYRADTKKLVGTKVTDKNGRYEFILKPGRYIIEVQKKKYKFPSSLLEKKETDNVYHGLYYGAEIEVKEKDAVALPIPLDPHQVKVLDKKERRINVGRKVQFILTWIAPTTAVVSFVISPSIKFAALIVAQFALYFLFNRLAIGGKPKSWGIIKDSEVKRPLSRAVVRVFDTKFNKLLETQVTDSKGRYAFLVGNSQYYVTAEKPGYYAKRSDIFNLEGKDTGYLAENLHLRSHHLGGNVKEAQKEGQSVTLRTGLGEQEEKIIDGKKKVVRPEAERFKKKIKNIDLKDMHEDYYDLDSLNN